MHNVNAERFIQTSLRERAYAQSYHNSDGRTAALASWMHRYHTIRIYSGTKHHIPMRRLKATLKMTTPAALQ